MDEVKVEVRDEVEGAGAERGLEEITTELVDMLGEKQRRWSAIYVLIEEVEERRLWSPTFRSMTKWMEDLARRARCQMQYLWRVKKAGKFYARWARERASAGGAAADVPPVADCALGDEMLADIDRLTEGNAERADRFMTDAMAGRLTKARVKELVRATAGRRAAHRAAASASDGSHDHDGGEDGRVTADAIVMALNPKLFHTEQELGAHLLHGARRVWQVLTEFPVQTGSADRARRMDALCVSNARGVDQYDVVLDMVEIKVSESDLERDTKHLEYEPFADRCWFAVPESLAAAALEAAPDGWGVLALGSDGALRVERGAVERRGEMRAVALATALVKVLPTMK